MSRLPPRALLLALLFGVAACERGCLGRRLPAGGTSTSDPLAVIDCPPGILRCRTGVVERHASATACATCSCAWVSTGTVCESGCALDELEVVRDERDAKTLCAAKPAELATFAPDAPPDAGAWACTDDGARFQCHGGVVYGCAGAGVPVATCAYGCVAEDDALTDDAIDVAGARLLACRRRATSGDP
jgi:hypothetical protein